MSSHIHGAIALLCPSPLAAELCVAFEEHNLRHSECEALVMISLPFGSDTDGELMAKCVRQIPAFALDNSLKKAQNDSFFPYVCGAGVNPTLFRWLRTNATVLDEHDQSFFAANGTHLALLSIVEISALAYGYPNCDFVGAVGHGTYESTDSSFLQTALREVAEESRLVLPADVAADGSEWSMGELSLPGTFVDRPRRLTLKRPSKMPDGAAAEIVSSETNEQAVHDDQLEETHPAPRVNTASAPTDNAPAQAVAAVSESEIHVFAFQVPPGWGWRFDAAWPVMLDANGNANLKGALVLEPSSVSCVGGVAPALDRLTLEDSS